MKKIVITGPESTGKTSIAGYLSGKYKVPVVNEFAVDFLHGTGGRYTYRDLLKIGSGQIQSEDELIEKTEPEVIICDTDLITIKIWSLIKYNKVNRTILKIINSRFYDHYILCAPDIEWEFSEFRENPNDRDMLFDYYKKELLAYKKDFQILEGQGENRIKNAEIIFEKMVNLQY